MDSIVRCRAAPLASGVDTVYGSDVTTGADRGRYSQCLCLHQPRTAARFRSIPDAALCAALLKVDA